MHKFIVVDFMYPAFFLVFGIVMILSPRTVMRKAKYDEESLKMESWIKRLGIGLCVFAVAFGIYMYFNLK